MPYNNIVRLGQKANPYAIAHRLSNGGEFLLQSHDDADMNQWVTALKAQCELDASGEGRSLTLPASSQKDEQKRRSFFTLKKK